MAQAIALNPVEDGIEGESLAFTVRILFLGTDLPNGPDASSVRFVVDPGDTAATIRDKLANAVKAEATRLGYPLLANRTLLPAYIKV